MMAYKKKDEQLDEYAARGGAKVCLCNLFFRIRRKSKSGSVLVCVRGGDDMASREKKLKMGERGTLGK